MSTIVTTPAADPQWLPGPAVPCARRNPDWWTGEEANRSRSREPRVVAMARALCNAECPVQRTCLAWALEHQQTGVWGGKLLRHGRVISRD